jgi:uncharacterized protein YraI
VRNGPSTTFSSFTFLSNGEIIEPLGRSPDGEWIRIRMEGSENEGWVFNSEEFVSCDGDVDVLPVINP